MDWELERWANREVPNESMEKCNAILPEDEQDEMVNRALEAHHDEEKKHE